MWQIIGGKSGRPCQDEVSNFLSSQPGSLPPLEKAINEQEVQEPGLHSARGCGTKIHLKVVGVLLGHSTKNCYRENGDFNHDRNDLSSKNVTLSARHATYSAPK